MLLSLFSGCGGLDLGFEQAGFSTGLSYDIRPHSIKSWNKNRPKNPVGRVGDINALTLALMDQHHGKRFTPSGVIGGPPCQSFTNANTRKRSDDPRAKMLPRFFEVALMLNRRSALDFVVMENVPEVATARYKDILDEQISALEAANFTCAHMVLNAYDYAVPQNRRRLFLVALNKAKFGGRKWQRPPEPRTRRSVRDAIGHLPSPTFFARNLKAEEIECHPNHWCMVPKSKKFGTDRLQPGKSIGRSFKMLDWSAPSFTVSYGNREVHVHPDGARRLSVYEAMLLQGFPKKFVLHGNLSEQITQVSEAVPPPLAAAIAKSIIAMRSPE
jgi:DNA (cytosine-5)-methyltransferase 1